jgi:fructoselysine-6-P-deglycase FrlB-like protein
MNIEQAKAAKAQLNIDIAELLRKFSNETGFVVEYVNIERLFVMGASISYVVTTDVKLS